MRYFIHVLVAVFIVELALHRSSLMQQSLPHAVELAPSFPSPSAEDLSTTTITSNRHTERCSPPPTDIVPSASESSSSIAVPPAGILLREVPVPPTTSDVSPDRSMLTLSAPAWPLTSGVGRGDAEVGNHSSPLVSPSSTVTVPSSTILKLPDSISRICVHIGSMDLTHPYAARSSVSSSSSTSTKKATLPASWMTDDATFVVALEPNPFKVAMIQTMFHPTFLSQSSGYWPLRWGTNCTPNNLRTLLSETTLFGMVSGGRLLVLPVQPSPDGRRGASPVALQGLDENQKESGLFSATAPLRDLLALLPARSAGGGVLLWHTLHVSTVTWRLDRSLRNKVGEHVVQVLQQAGPRLRYFGCVTTDAHFKRNEADWQMLSAFLHSVGFVEQGNKQVFANAKFSEHCS